MSAGIVSVTSAPPPGSVRRRRGSAVCAGDRLDDRQPETRAPASASNVRPAEALEGVRQELRRESPAVVPDRQLDRTVFDRAHRAGPSLRRGGARCRRGCRAPARGGDDLPRSPSLATQRPRATGRLRALASRSGPRPRPAPRGHGGARRLRSSLPSSARASTSRSPASRTSRSTSSAAERRACSLLVSRARAAESELELRLEQAERGAKLVARVGHEAPLARDPGLEPSEHLVQRLAQTTDLVVSLGKR